MAFLAFLKAHRRPLLQAGILLGAGLAVGLVLPPAPRTPDLKAPPPEVLFLGGQPRP